MIKNLYTDPKHNSYNNHHTYMGSELWDVIQEQIREVEKHMEWCIEAIDHEKYGD